MTVFIIVLAALLIYFMQSRFYEKMWKRELKIVISFNTPEIIEGNQSFLNEIVENHKVMPLPSLKIKYSLIKGLYFPDSTNSSLTDQYYHYDFFSVSMYQKITKKVLFTAEKRGYYQIKKVDIVGYDFLLHHEFRDEKDNDTFLYVIPKCFNSPTYQILLHNIKDEILADKNIIEDPFEFTGIRDYQPTDSLKSINWKATAKIQSLMVNKKGYTTGKNIKLILLLEDNNAFLQEDKSELSITVTASQINFFSQNGCSISLDTNVSDTIEDTLISEETGCGSAHSTNLLRKLARLDYHKNRYPILELVKKSLLEISKEGCFNIYICNVFHQQIKKEFSQSDRQKYFYWFYPLLDGKQFPHNNEIPDYLKIIH